MYVKYKFQQYESLAISQSNVMKTFRKLSADAGVQDVAMAVHTKNGSNNKKGPQQVSAPSQQSNQQQAKQKREPMTEERAKALGLRKLSCCGKYGSHKPADCRNPAKKLDSGLNTTSAHATVSETKPSKPKHRKDASDIALLVHLRDQLSTMMTSSLS